MTDSETRITLDAGGRAIQRLVVVATLVVAAGAFAMGVPALVAAGSAAGLGLTAWLAPVVVDGGLTTAGLAAAVRRSQGRRSTVETALMAGLTLLSMAVQAIHAWSAGHGTVVDMVAAAAVAAVAPLAVLAATHIALDAVLAEPAKGKRRITASKATAAATTPVAAPASRKSHPTPAAAQHEPLAELIPLVQSGELSRRKAAERAGVSRHRVDAALSEAA